MLLGATTIFAQLQKALNQIWEVEPRPGNALGHFLKQRLLSLAVVASVGFLLLISLVASAVLAGLQGYIDARMPGSALLWRALNAVLSLGIFTLLFAVIYRVMPDVNIAWKDTWMGAFITAVLFAIGKLAIGLYLGQASVGSAFGAAGSLVVFMVWIYYASLILFLGAEMSHSRRGLPAGNSGRSHPRPRIHPASGALRAHAASESRIARRASPSTLHSPIEMPPAGCTWVSWKPGRTMRPPRSSTSVSSPTKRSASSLVPTNTMRSARTAMAWAGSAETMV
jgi:hypothetical protein